MSSLGSQSMLQQMVPHLALALVDIVEGRLIAPVVDLHIGAEALPLRARWLLALHTTRPQPLSKLHRGQTPLFS